MYLEDGSYFWYGYKNFDHHFTMLELDKAFIEAIDNADNVELHRGKKGVCYYNIPVSFDIETSSFLNGVDEHGNPVKAGCMYIWQFGLNGTAIYGRTWDEYFILLNALVDKLHLNKKRRVIIYDHNLGFEFQWIRKRFNWDKVFSIKQRRPVQCITGGLEFRCSYFLSNYSLAYIGDEMLHKYPIKKLVGELDYSKVRHSETPLTPNELEYSLNDVRVLNAYIQEKIENDGGIENIPLTNTGYVRKYCREECFYGNAKTEEEKKRVMLNYKAMMKSLRINNKEEYEQLHRAFAGGFTHASALYSGKVMYDVGHADFTSSYPYVMIAEYFPMTRFEYIGNIDNPKLFNTLLSKYCCLFDVEFTNLQASVECENIISLSHSKITGKYVNNNGRIVSADKLLTTCTELDFNSYSKFYKWDSIKVVNMRISHRGYLPKALILAILNMYKDKTELKGIDGKEVEYLVSKNMINASFGMMVTGIIRDEIIYDDDSGEWIKIAPDKDSQLESYNRNFNRFLYYAWGVWVTAHARHNLMDGIYEFQNDYIYSDTDSLFGLNFENHKEYFEKYNRNVIMKLLKMCNYYKIPFSYCQPKTKKGVKKLIGVWDFEDFCTRFKTIGAKRYLLENATTSQLELTVAGLNKKFALPWLLEEYKTKDALFEVFSEGMFIPKGHTGKMTMTYIEDEQQGYVTDYLGNTSKFHELSSVHAAPQSFMASQTLEYQKFLRGVRQVEI